MAAVIRREQAQAEPAYALPDFERRARDILAHAERQVEALLTAARQKAAEIESAGRARAQELHREAHEQGLAAGREEGRQALLREVEQARAQAAQEMQAELRTVAQALEKACAELERERNGLLARAEAGLIELALAIAGRVCRITAMRSTEPALANARSLLEMVRHCDEVELHLHPLDCGHAATILPQRRGGGDGVTHVHIVADAEVERGGCVLRTSAGVIEANLSTQLDRIAEALCGGTDTAADVAQAGVDHAKPTQQRASASEGCTQQSPSGGEGRCPGPPYAPKVLPP